MIKIKFREQQCKIKIKFNIGTILGDDMLEPWIGPYRIKPKVQEQNFETENKKMEGNLTVEEIPLQEVSNPHGGTTLIIE